ncbi:phosphatidylinositol-4-phosphate 5-kinase family protein [Cavenderia fasciculata]|uniref:Phosphatidylinositol-4-phosphate 5-kinase family protein n=1 Tax=Cavenderia fasciculata TaxID=261658 RepID=F4Q8A3_CACFS|nr:phosphatidylinositol-4-phosphate 5-kinase family protein [Cavenderia fasciculata]EGG16003.1 phosphatidylinositol-4-phosphate 5-kinase family protein [Cavenderia fasciculata]|eukprot:XP_004352328.1 phosphatidylinositol-4-phosphate 5-kinase family protein [Cavenderia fasciculata]
MSSKKFKSKLKGTPSPQPPSSPSSSSTSSSPSSPSSSPSQPPKNNNNKATPSKLLQQQQIIKNNLKNDKRANTLMKKSQLFAKSIAVIGDQGSFLHTLLTSVLMQYECRVHMISIETAATDASTRLSSSVINPSELKEADNNDLFEQTYINVFDTKSTEELAKVTSRLVDIIEDIDYVIVCFEWTQYKEMYRKLDIVSTCCRTAITNNNNYNNNSNNNNSSGVAGATAAAESGNPYIENNTYTKKPPTIIVSFPIGIEDEGGSNKSIESMFDGMPTSFLFYSALMQWLFVGPPRYNEEIELMINEENDQGCYWLDCDDLIKVIVEILLLKTENANRLHVLTGKECLTGKEIATILYNETNIIVHDYGNVVNKQLAEVEQEQDEQTIQTQASLMELQKHFFNYLRSPISTIVSPDIELFLGQPTILSEFISKCSNTQLFTIISEKEKENEKLKEKENEKEKEKGIEKIKEIEKEKEKEKELLNNINTCTDKESEINNNNNLSPLEISTPIVQSPQQKEDLSVGDDKSSTSSSSNNQPSSSSTPSSTTAAAAQSSSSSSFAYKVVSSPFTFLKYSKAFIEETIYKPANKKKEDNSETNTWILLLSNGFKRMLEDLPSPDISIGSSRNRGLSSGNLSSSFSEMTPEEYTTQSTYEVLDDYQLTWQFTTYAPKVFQKIRSFYNVEHFLKCHQDIVEFIEVTTIGRSGSFFFKSKDEKYFIKTIPHNEFLTFTKIFQSYHQHIDKHPNSLLPRFYGLFRLKGKLHVANSNGNDAYRERDIVFVIMENLFYSHSTMLELSEKYDLKGSTVGRYVDIDELDCTNTVPTLKDLNLKRKIHIGPCRVLLQTQLEIDTDWMQSHYICDYSLLLGIHVCNKSTSPSARPASYSPSSSSSSINAAAHHHQRDISFFKKDLNGIQSCTSKTHKKYITLIPIKNLKSGKSTLPQENGNGGGDPTPPPTAKMDTMTVHTSDQPGYDIASSGEESGNELDDTKKQQHEDEEDTELIYFIGLIDTLTTYDMKKRGEHAIKSVIFDRNQISAISPKDYRSRFIAYTNNIID